MEKLKGTLDDVLIYFEYYFYSKNEQNMITTKKNADDLSET